MRQICRTRFRRQKDYVRHRSNHSPAAAPPHHDLVFTQITNKLLIFRSGTLLAPAIDL